MKKKTFIVQLLDSKKPSRTSFTQVEDANFYSNDTDASLVFIPHEDTFDFQSAKVVMYNRGDESLVERDMEVTTEDGRKVASYELPDEIISHWGQWIAQPVFINDDEIYSGAIVPFLVDRHLMHERPPKLTEVVTVTKFVQQSQELVNAMIQAEAQRITEEQVRQSSEENRVQAESERSDKYESYAQQFNDVITELSEEKDYHSLPEIAGARGGFDTLGERLNDTATKTELQSVASGSPKGVYPSLANLQNAFPTGNTNIYVVLEDGNWYYWNGTAWASGGIYQGTVSADGVPAMNIIKNGDFSNGFTSWLQNSSSNVHVFENGALNITFNSSYGFMYQILSDVVVGDVIYAKADVKADTNNAVLNVQHKSGVATLEVRHSGSNNYEQLSGILKLPEDTNLGYVRARISDYRTANWTPIGIKNFIVLNLTKVFGAGNEPTKEEFEKLLAKFPNGWFDGTKSLYTFKEVIDKLEETDASVSQIQNDLSNIGGGIKNVYVNYSDANKQFDIFIKSGEGNKYFKTEFEYFNSPAFTDGGVYQNYNLWRLVKGYFGTFNGTTFTQTDEFLNGGAWETAIKVEGYPDFSGTYHGYELMDSITFFVDGIKTDFTANQLFDCEEFEVIYKSRLIKQGTADEAIANVARHYKFNKDGITLRQQFKWLQTLTISSGNVAMLSAKRFAIQGDNTSKQITDRVITDYDYETYDVSQDGHSTVVSGRLVNNVHYAKLWGETSGYYADVKVEYDDDTISKKFNVANSVAYNKLYFSYGDGEVVNANEIWGMTALFKFRS